MTPLFITYRGVGFVRAKVRKAAECWNCGHPIMPGAYAYRPLSNSSERFRRLDERCVRFLAGNKK